jgi:hypothetical protein
MKMFIATTVATLSLIASIAYAGPKTPYYGSTTNGNAPEWAQKAFSGSDK